MRKKSTKRFILTNEMENGEEEKKMDGKIVIGMKNVVHILSIR